MFKPSVIGAGVLVWIGTIQAWAAGPGASDGVPSPIGSNSMGAASPMTDYTIAAVAYVLIGAFLVALLLIGGMLVLNLGLLSKRDRDLTGGRTPSDVGILKNTNWPRVRESETTQVLPAEDWDEVERTGTHIGTHSDAVSNEVPTERGHGRVA